MDNFISGIKSKLIAYKLGGSEHIYIYRILDLEGEVDFMDKWPSNYKSFFFLKSSGVDNDFGQDQKKFNVKGSWLGRVGPMRFGMSSNSNLPIKP